MVKKIDVCGLHCSMWTKWLFVVLAAWFTLSAFGVPVFGGFWSWLVLLSGICGLVCLLNPQHQKTDCPFTIVPVWLTIAAIVVGAWFVLGNAEVLPTFGLNLLYVVALGLGAWAVTYRG